MKILDELTFKELLKNIKQLNVHTESVFFYCRYLEYHIDVYALKKDDYKICELSTYEDFELTELQKEYVQDMVDSLSLPDGYAIEDNYENNGVDRKDFI